jgi:hypothetical protein
MDVLVDIHQEMAQQMAVCVSNTSTTHVVDHLRLALQDIGDAGLHLRVGW